MTERCGETMRTSELAEASGWFWESAGLVSPDRVEARAGTARMYRDTAIRDARITSALRTGGYRIPEVREAIGALRELGDASRSLTALDERRKAVARRTLALFRAGSVLVDLIDTDHR
ncbi:MAG: MerR family transcriptional regulator [Brevibacterium sp.]|nr:MerR family transcriptional regulator [Brevibacterium sp.]